MADRASPDRVATPLRLRSYKLRFMDTHAWIVPATDALGCPFAGPGVTLRGETAKAAFLLAAPLLERLAEYEPGAVVRALSMELERPRLLVSFEGPVRPRVVRLDAGAALERLREVTPALESYLVEAAVTALGRRLAPSGT